MNKFINHANYKNDPYADADAYRETFIKGSSKTKPDQTMSLQELINRFTRGGEVATLTPVYAGDADFPDIDRMDPMERLDYARQIEQEIEHEKAKIARNQARAAKRKKDKEAKQKESKNADVEEAIVIPEPAKKD